MRKSQFNVLQAMLILFLKGWFVMNAIISALQTLLLWEDPALYPAVSLLAFLVGLIASYCIAPSRSSTCTDSELNRKDFWVRLKGGLGFVVYAIGTMLMFDVTYVLANEEPPDSLLPAYCSILAVAAVAFAIGATISIISGKMLTPDEEQPKDEIPTERPILLEKPQMETISLRIDGGALDIDPEHPLDLLDIATDDAQQTADEKEWVMAVSSDGEWEKYPAYLLPGLGCPIPPSTDFDKIHIVP